ncbi:Ppx/GppA phosphatase family protein [Massilia sp. IC2-476]|uniref:Ppx/GppA phosphatase family protein n=1 Tax=Massilia sp. IC2-476 TaxID=2887199 RepID=UPI001D12B3BC|nr:Ppx/GppA phosphatase family protein [Massilia sp. IC2-476]MCC2973941.1 Ppx/GppA family phosphatase [Massilia sp. IC2-476]
MFAAVDLGSNSFRLHIGEPAGGRMHIVRTARDPIRLAAGLDHDNMLTEAAMKSAVRSLEGFRAILDEYTLEAVRVVATNTLRVARNAEQLLPQLERAIGYPVEVISGEEEGRLIYMGVARAIDRLEERRLVIDIGGGSTEVIAAIGPEINLVESFGIGTHPQTAAFFADGRITPQRFDAAVTEARARFEDAADLYKAQGWDAAYGSSGTMRAIAEVLSKNSIGDGSMSQASLHALRDILLELGHVDAFNMPGIKKERVPVMVGGLTVLIGVMQELGVQQLTAINAGLRLGVLSDLELRANRRDRRDAAIRACMRRFGVDSQRALRTSHIASTLYEKLEPLDARHHYLCWSAMLHEAGLSISMTGAHKHGAYIVEHADLPGFTTREQRLMSTLVLGQKGNLRKIREALDDTDVARAVLALRMAVVFMHARADNDIGGVKARMKSRFDTLRIELELPAELLDRHPTLGPWLAKEEGAWNEVGIPFHARIA